MDKTQAVPGTREDFERVCSIAAYMRVKASFDKTGPVGRPIVIDGETVMIDGRPVYSTGGINTARRQRELWRMGPLDGTNLEKV